MILRSDRFDTTPGAISECSVLAPPADFAGDSDAYTEWLRSRYDDHPLIRQVLAIQALHGDNPRHPKAVFEGPFAAALEAAVLRLRAWLRSGPKKRVTPIHRRDEDEIYEALSDLQCVDDAEEIPEPLVLA